MLYYNTAMFDAAGLAYPTDDWTFDDLREAALQLTLDAEGRDGTDPEFDAENVVQWGFNTSPNNIWARHFLAPFEADPCGNEDCTELAFSSPESVAALQWWADLVQAGAAPYDPYSGNQTGVPGDPFSAGLAAMGYNGYFLIGQLNATEPFEYDVVQPPLGETGTRATPLSTNGWAIPASLDAQQQEAAWALIEELTSPDFLAEYWAQPGHAVPSRISAGESILAPDAAPANRAVILDALEYAEVFRPFTASAFEAYGRTTETFVAMMKGDISVEEGAAQIDDVGNEVLARDRE
jgi:multiple sugar transport system substrate-binding protein